MVIENDIIKINSGDINAFREFYLKHFSSFVSFSLNYIPEITVCEDIVQESFIAFWENRDKINDIRSAKAYLYTSIKNKCLNHIRQVSTKRNHHAEFTSEVFFRDSLIEQETLAAIRDTIEQLPERTREIMKQSLNGARNKDIAESLGCTINTVQTMKQRAYRKMRENLKYSFPSILF